MLCAAFVLAFLTATDNEVTENFTGRVLEGSNDRLIRVERKPTPGKRPTSIVVLENCGSLEPGTLHQFMIWAGAWEDVRACLAVNGRPPQPVMRSLPSGFGILYGEVKVVEEDSTRRLPLAPVEIRCGDKLFTGKSDRSGRFWTMLPAGQCRVDGAAEGYRTVDPNGQTVAVRDHAVELAVLQVKPWGFRQKLESLFQGLFNR